MIVELGEGMNYSLSQGGVILILENNREKNEIRCKLFQSEEELQYWFEHMYKFVNVDGRPLKLKLIKE